MKLKRISIEPAENGFELEACYEKPAAKGKENEAMCMPGYDEKKFVCASVRDLMDRVGKLVKTPEADMADYLDGADGEPAEGTDSPGEDE